MHLFPHLLRPSTGRTGDLFAVLKNMSYSWQTQEHLPAVEAWGPGIMDVL